MSSVPRLAPAQQSSHLSKFLPSGQFTVKLKVREELLLKHNWTEVIATNIIENKSFLELLEELRNDQDCPMCWRWIKLPPGIEGIAHLIEHENKKRPTTILSYYGVDRFGNKTLVGTASISDKIDGPFPHEGFPIISRCFIRKAYRHQGLYSLIAGHRILLCFELWGPSLNGIHFGSSQETIEQFYSNREFKFKKFLPIGSEYLAGSALPVLVVDFFYFTTSYAEAIVRGCHWKDGPTPDLVIELQNRLSTLVTTGFDTAGFCQLKKLIQKIVSQTGWNPLTFNKALSKFIDFCEAIPLIEPDL